VSHCDPETLALRSLGEVVGTPEEDTHLTSCEQCQTELASLRTVVVGARSSGPDLALESPPPHVWDRIRAEVGIAPPVTTVVATVVPLDERRRRRANRPATWLLAAAGIGGIVVGGVVTATVLGGSSPQDAEVAASVDLAPLPEWTASGTADLTVTEDGQQVLVVSLDAEASGKPAGYQEVWLIDENVEGMVSLGVLEGTSGEFVIPQGVDVGSFPIVDVSLEPFDGDPTHSGDSIARGTINA